MACALTLTWQVSLLTEMTSSTLSGVRERETERRDAVAHLEVAVLELVADRRDRAEQHAAGARVRVMVLAAVGDDAEAVLGHLLDVAALGLLDLREAGRVDVERVDVDEDLVVVDLHRVVDLPRRLRQDALGLDDPVGSELVAFLHPCSLPRREAGRGRRQPAPRPAESGVVSWGDISPLP